MNTEFMVLQLDRISDFGSEGWGFESSRGHLRIKKRGSLEPFFYKHWRNFLNCIFVKNCFEKPINPIRTLFGC